MNAPSCSPTTSVASLAARAGHAFTPHAMMQGLACHARGVELSDVADARVRARVRSKRTHDVLLEVDASALVVACSCPARSLGLTACRHAWAALLEIDRQGALPALRGAGAALVVQAAPVAAPAAQEHRDGPRASSTPTREVKPAGRGSTPRREAKPARRGSTQASCASKPSATRAPRSTAEGRSPRDGARAAPRKTAAARRSR